MNQRNPDHSRRLLLKASAAGLAALPLGLAARSAFAADLPKLELDNPTAQALSYTHDASAVGVDVRGGERNCANCQLFGGGDWGSCALFPGKAVSKAGWCKGWVAKA